ncbi:MAG TPA: DUF892 family protein [Terracidiphilus sp.]|jgi:ferritin-like metal-binding protein YciE
MIEKATDIQLKQAFQSHLQETTVQVTHLEDRLERATGKPRSVQRKVTRRTGGRSRRTDQRCFRNSVRDAALTAAARRVKYYEIASYGAVRRFARILGESEAAGLLDQTIKEEALLSEIADRVNPYAEKAA